MRFSELEGRRVGAWGAAREIRALSGALAAHLPGTPLAMIATEAAGAATPDWLPEGTGYVAGPGAPAALADCDVVVRSPGVSAYRPELAVLRDRGVVVTTTTSLWMAEVQGHAIVAVTGTKGKSTTAALVAHVLTAAGRSTRLAGNIGVPALQLLGEAAPDVYVIELSSFQVADLTTGPTVAVFTNLAREHVDWHGSEAAYFGDKLKLGALPEVEVNVYNERDPRLREAAAGWRARGVAYGAGHGWGATPEALLRDGVAEAAAADLPLRGEHNLLNLCAALSAVEAVGVAPPPPVVALEGFAALPHRLEPVAEIAGVQWVNDSISTTPISTLAALAAHPQQGIVLIGGGFDRGQDYATLGAELARREARVVGVGQTGKRVVAAAAGHGVPAARTALAADLAGAVGAAARLARAGDVVLLSPAAPSFGEHADFERRGEHFRALVAGLNRG